MQIDLKIDSEAVQSELVASLIRSGIGEQINKVIREKLLASDWRHGTVVEQAVHSALHEELRALAHKIIRERETEFRELIVAALTPEKIQEAIASLVDRMWKPGSER